MSRNTRSPRWGVDSARAFKFPVTCPYSSVDVAINDSDADPFNPDDGLGRVCIDLSQFTARTIYDAWFALQYDNHSKTNGKKGWVRLRPCKRRYSRARV